MTITNVLKELRKQSGWVVRVRGTTLELVRSFNGRPVTILLTYSRGKYRIRFPSYIFNSTISHFAPNEPESRFCRNKALLTSVVGVLKRSAVWACIDNKDFMVVNSANKKADKSRLRTELQSLYSYTPREITRKKTAEIHK